MTDPGLADATYIEPITPEIVEKHHRAREARRAAADHGRPDRAQHRDGARREPACSKQLRRRADRRQGRGDRPRRGPAEVPRRDGRDRHRKPAQRHRAHAGGGARGAGRDRPAGGHPARASPWAAPAAASPTTGRSSSRSSQRRPRRLAHAPRCWSRRACSAGRNSRWRWSATARTTASSSARSRTSTRWACTPATASPSRPR